MRIREIRLQPFRNFREFRLPLDAARILLLGRNGYGKSNILEAISYLSIAKSVRGAKDREAVPHGGQYFDIEAFCHNGKRESQLRIYFEATAGKKAFCNRAPLSRIAELIGQFRSVHFSPEDVSLVLRFPGQRRRLLDILLSQSRSSYLTTLQRYNRTLAQRNQLLRRYKQTGVGPDDVTLRAWDVKFAEAGAAIRAERLAALEKIRECFKRYYQPFALPGEIADIEYHGARGSDEQTLQTELLQELQNRRPQERMQGHTLTGPHRDDVAFLLNGHAADSFASEGQLKTMLIAWKLAEVRFLELETEEQPVLLLDDVLSELDSNRAATLMHLIDEFEQVLLTSPKKLEKSATFETVQLGN